MEESKFCNISIYRRQTPSACSNLSLPNSASPFCNAANANFVNSIASASCSLDNVAVVFDFVEDVVKEGAIDEKSPVVLEEDEIGVVRGTVATGDGDRGFDVVGE